MGECLGLLSVTQSGLLPLVSLSLFLKNFFPDGNHPISPEAPVGGGQFPTPGVVCSFVFLFGGCRSVEGRAVDELGMHKPKKTLI